MQGEITHIWMSRDTGNKSRYGLRTLGGIAGIVILALLLACGGSVLGIVMGWPAEVYALALCLAVTLLAVCLAAGVGRRSVRDATVFFLMEGDRLFVMDARRLVYQGRISCPTRPPWQRFSSFCGTWPGRPICPPERMRS